MGPPLASFTTPAPKRRIRNLPRATVMQTMITGLSQRAVEALLCTNVYISSLG
jgi:hypothetical protein